MVFPSRVPFFALPELSMQKKLGMRSGSAPWAGKPVFAAIFASLSASSFF